MECRGVVNARGRERPKEERPSFPWWDQVGATPMYRLTLGDGLSQLLRSLLATLQQTGPAPAAGEDGGTFSSVPDRTIASQIHDHGPDARIRLILRIVEMEALMISRRIATQLQSFSGIFGHQDSGAQTLRNLLQQRFGRRVDPVSHLPFLFEAWQLLHQVHQGLAF